MIHFFDPSLSLAELLAQKDPDRARLHGF